MNTKMYIQRSLIATVLGLLVFAQCVPVARADGFQRIAANRLDSSFEISTTLAPSGTPAASGGFIIYNHPVVSSDDANVLFVTIHATGDTHGGARLMLSCLIDDVACDPNSAFVPLAPAGWVTILRHRDYNKDYVSLTGGFSGDGGGGAGDLHDNNISYSWCGAISVKDESRAFTWEDDPPYWNSTHNIKIKLASGQDDTGVSGHSPVFLDSVHIYVDAGHIRAADRCTTVAPGK
jgi:hypothetical protein